MNAGFLPLALLCAALGLAMSRTPVKHAAAAIAALVATSLSAYALAPAEGWETSGLLALWISAALTAVLCYLPRGLDAKWVFLTSINTGLWVGFVAHGAGGGVGIASAVPFALLFLPAAWLLEKELGAAVKIAASWIVAVSILAGMIVISPTPGYAPDHMQ